MTQSSLYKEEFILACVPEGESTMAEGHGGRESKLTSQLHTRSRESPGSGLDYKLAEPAHSHVLPSAKLYTLVLRVP